VPLPTGIFSDLDRHFARFIERLAGGDNPELALAAATVSRKRSEGHICLDLPAVAGKKLPDAADDAAQPITCPELDTWKKKLWASPVVGAPGEFKPLILDEAGRLYLHRYWEFETALAAEVKRRVSEAASAPAAKLLNECIDRLFTPVARGEADWQRAAALTAVLKQFCVISGGPGTGKTWTLVRILALLLELAQGKPLRIAVAAPTGKAAARIQDEIRAAKEQLPCPDTIKAQLPEQATTIHRLLGATPDSALFRHNANNPLPTDVVAVDEASMVDLALMAKLFAAIPASAKVILLGDKDQLASVEAGAVLGDICAGLEGRAATSATKPIPIGAPCGGLETVRPTLSDCIVQLRKNYRFAEDSAIQRLANAINDGDVPHAIEILNESGAPESGLAWRKLPEPRSMKSMLREKLLAGFAPYFAANDPLASLDAQGRFRVLCALRAGPYGVARLNELAEEIFEDAGLIRRTGPWYSRRPIMVTRNDYALRLFNGDTGAVTPDDEGGACACFLGAEGELRKVLPARLPEHETAYGMTVHKSQGSEFERVLIILPDCDVPILTRELLYTAITRARAGVEIWATEAVLATAIARRMTRNSGLRDALWTTS
jgi:exodeoxyribonuclease V alpha subunit